MKERTMTPFPLKRERPVTFLGNLDYLLSTVYIKLRAEVAKELHMSEATFYRKKRMNRLSMDEKRQVKELALRCVTELAEDVSKIPVDK